MSTKVHRPWCAVCIERLMLQRRESPGMPLKAHVDDCNCGCHAPADAFTTRAAITERPVGVSADWNRAR